MNTFILKVINGIQNEVLFELTTLQLIIAFI